MHEDLGTAVKGQRMYDNLTDLAAALAAFAADLGPAGMAHGHPGHDQRVRPPGRRERLRAALDHGHGNAMLLLGGGVRGGKVYGRWPGLAPARAGRRRPGGDHRLPRGDRRDPAEALRLRRPDRRLPGREPVRVRPGRRPLTGSTTSAGPAVAGTGPADACGLAGGAGAALGPDVEGDRGEQDRALDQHDLSRSGRRSGTCRC